MSETLPSVPGYRILSVVGRGAMATVYRAEHQRLKKIVALKVMEHTVAEDEEYRERFLREARAAAKLNHQNLVRALDAGYANGVYYISMELVEGTDLRRKIEEEGILPEKEALDVALAVAHALDEASRHGIVHRDVKPENILLAPDGTVKLTDLGLAKVQGEDLTLTKKGLTVGTVAYFAPEQALGQPDLDVRTDVYALGATLYAAVTGELPFGRGENVPETMQKILTEPPPPVAELAPDVSVACRKVIERFMEKDRKKRPQSAREAIRLLHAARHGEVAAGREPVERLSGRGSARITKRRRLRTVPRAGLGVAIAAAVLLLVGVLVLAVVFQRDPEADPPDGALAADSPSGRALARLVHARLEFGAEDVVSFDYGAGPAGLRDFAPSGSVSEGAPGTVSFKLRATERAGLRHVATLHPPVTVSYELSIGERGEPARFATWVLDEQGTGLASSGGARLEAWSAASPPGQKLAGEDAPLALLEGGRRRVIELAFGAAATARVDARETYRAAVAAPPTCRVGFSAEGPLVAEVSRLRVRGRVDRAWLSRAASEGPR